MEPTINNINVDTEDGEVVFRTGKAQELDRIKPVRLSGTMDAPVNYFDINKDKLKDRHIVLIVEEENGVVRLEIDPQNEMDTVTITGRILISNEVQKVFQINKKADISREELLNLCRLNRHLFANRTEAMSLASSLQNFDAKIEKAIKKSNDDRGNRSVSIRQTAETELPDIVDLKIPVFKGGVPKVLSCNLYFTVQGDDLKFFFQSEELNELINSVTKEKMADVVSFFEDQSNVAIIEK